MKADFDWSDLAFTSKKPVRALKATFIAAPRELSQKRLAQLIKQYLPKGNIVIGVAKELFVLGFEGQPQFKMLQLDDAENIVNKVKESTSPHKIYTLSYFQHEQKHLFEKISFTRAVFVSGSWKYMLHTSETFYALVRAGIPYDQVSPFADEQEALVYDADKRDLLLTATASVGSILDEAGMLRVASEVSRGSYDSTYQTGVSLGKSIASGEYALLAASFNKVVPYQTYAWHFGPLREVNFSAPGDLNHYDAVHAEVQLLIKAAREEISLSGATIFINLLPCPSCARMFAETDIAELVYSEDHSAGYAVALLEKAGKKVRRFVPEINYQKEG